MATALFSIAWHARWQPFTCIFIRKFCSLGRAILWRLSSGAVDRISNIERRRVPFVVKAVLLDRGSAQKSAAAARYARKNGIHHVIWQEPDHEGFLLRHLPGCHHRRPPRGASLAALQQQWPEYEKGMSAQALARRIDLERVRATCAVEHDLRSFLQRLGLLT